MQYQEVAGGICAPKGFAAAGVHCGIRANHNEKYDLALIKAEVRCAAAGVYTTNKVCGAPIKVDRAHLKDGYAQAILVNSGNANTCAANGVALAEECCALVGEALHIPAEDVLPASTGVIGQPMVIDPFARGIPAAAAKLAAFRAEQPDFLDLSFDTIAGYGPHGAIVHYEATEETDVPLEAHGLLLADTGGHYRIGTTDVTRTVALGPVAGEEKRACTLVLRGHLALAAARFRAGVTGENLDILARGPLWDEGLDYNHGTGHGVGFISGVHEGPQSLRPNNPVIFKPGMTITDEPGIYETDEVGIRIENELECIDLGENQYGHWLGFTPLTLVPISTEPVLVDELSRDQINWLNDYHAHVYEMLSPRLNEDEKVWLKEKCAAIGR